MYNAKAVMRLAVVALLGAVACTRTDDAEFSPRVWAVDVDTDADRYGNAYAAARAGDHDEVTLRPAVFATVCPPQAHDYLENRGGGLAVHNGDSEPHIQ